VLLDYADWAFQNDIHIEAMSSTAIPLSHLKQLIKEQNISFFPGDILFVRSGFTIAYNALSLNEQKILAERASPDFIGIEASKDVLEWLWENQFSAVAGDAPSFERAPIAGPHADLDVMLHQWLLGGWECL
jgi:kynurenine formamidase